MEHTLSEIDIAEFTHAVGLFVRRVRAASLSHDLSWSEAAVMGRLQREGAATTADLARAEGVKPQSMGTTIAALEQRKIVMRKPHPTDGRQWLIELTAEGHALRQASKDAGHTWLAEAIAHLGTEEQATLQAATGIIQRLAEL